MNALTIALSGLGILVLGAIAFFAVFRQKGKLQIDTRLGNLRAEGENAPPPSAIPTGASMESVEATGDATNFSTGPGGASMKSVKTGGSATNTYTPGATPPKT